ncbi:hypothetical protein GCM10011408_17040 [Dyella caseinilytica]|nr:hypothetical protein GCM10011408_17040 [Dyella caseinilytica]
MDSAAQNGMAFRRFGHGKGGGALQYFTQQFHGVRATVAAYQYCLREPWIEGAEHDFERVQAAC